jgi:general secretion pathway protein I
MTRAIPSQESGFSLIEALVALSVLAIATVGLMRTVEAHIDSTRSVERRTTAMWVAENRLAELEVGGRIVEGDQVEMLGQQWRVDVARARTDDPEIERVRIQVFPAAERAPLASLDGFVDGRKG